MELWAQHKHFLGGAFFILSDIDNYLYLYSMDASNEIPRRSRIDLFIPAEKAIYDAAQEVEKLPADVRLTDAVNLLQQARDKVADFVDMPCEHTYKCTLDTDMWSSYKCTKCGYTKIVDFE